MGMRDCEGLWFRTAATAPFVKKAVSLRITELEIVIKVKNRAKFA